MARILQWGIPVCICVADQKVLVSNLNFAGRVGNAGIRTPELFSQLPSQATFLAKSQITLTFLNDFTGHNLPPRLPHFWREFAGLDFIFFVVGLSKRVGRGALKLLKRLTCFSGRLVPQ